MTRFDFIVFVLAALIAVVVAIASGSIALAALWLILFFIGLVLTHGGWRS